MESEPVPPSGVAASFSEAWRLFRGRLWLSLAVGGVGTAATVVSLVLPLIFGVVALVVLPPEIAFSAGGLAALCAGLWVASWAQVALMEGLLAEEKPSWADCYRVSWPKILPFSWVFVLLTVAVFGGFCLFILPGLFLGVALALAPVAAVAEGAAGLEALSRSLELVRGRFWTVAGRLFLLSLLWLVLGMVPFIGWLLEGLATLYLMAAFIVLYRELSSEPALEPAPAWCRRLPRALAALGLALMLGMGGIAVAQGRELWPAFLAYARAMLADPQRAQQALALLQRASSPEDIAAAKRLLQAPAALPQLSTGTVALEPATPALP